MIILYHVEAVLNISTIHCIISFMIKKAKTTHGDGMLFDVLKFIGTLIFLERIASYRLVHRNGACSFLKHVLLFQVLSAESTHLDASQPLSFFHLHKTFIQKNSRTAVTSLVHFGIIRFRRSGFWEFKNE